MTNFLGWILCWTILALKLNLNSETFLGEFWLHILLTFPQNIESISSYWFITMEYQWYVAIVDEGFYHSITTQSVQWSFAKPTLMILKYFNQ